MSLPYQLQPRDGAIRQRKIEIDWEGAGETQRQPRPPRGHSGASRGHQKRSTRRNALYELKDESNEILVSKFKSSRALQGVKILIERLPLFAKRIDQDLGPRAKYLDEILDTLLMKVYLASTHPHEKSLQALRDSLNALRRPSPTGIANLDQGSPICRLSTSIACDCLLRLSETDPLLKLLAQHLIPAVLMDGASASRDSLYSCVPWVHIAKTGQAIDGSYPNTLERAFNQASAEHRAVFLAKLFESKVLTDIEKRRASLISLKSDITVDGTELRFSFSDESMKEALDALTSPPVDLLVAVLQHFPLAEINASLPLFRIARKVENVFGHASVLKTKLAKFRDRVTLNEKSKVVQYSRPQLGHGAFLKDGDMLIDTLRDSLEHAHGELFAILGTDDLTRRRKVLQDLLILESDETCLAEVLIIVLDQVMFTESSAEIFNHVLKSEIGSVKKFISTLIENEHNKQDADLDINVNTALDDERKVEGAPPQLGLGQVERAGRLLTCDMLPREWQQFCGSATIDLNIAPTKNLELLILDMLLSKMEADRSRSEQVSAGVHWNMPTFPGFVVEYFLTIHGKKEVARKEFLQMIAALSDASAENEWVNMFKWVCMVDGAHRCFEIHEPALQCMLVALDVVGGHLAPVDLNLQMEEPLPALEIEIFLDAITHLGEIFSYIDLGDAKATFGAVEKLPLDVYLTFVFNAALSQTRKNQACLYSVLADFGGDTNGDYDLEQFQLLLTFGLERVEKRARSYPTCRDLYCSLLAAHERLTPPLYAKAVCLQAQPGCEAVTYRSHVQASPVV